MKIRVGLLATLTAFVVFMLSSCGGGGGAILDIVHEGKFTSASGAKPAEMDNSEFYKQLKKVVSQMKQQIRSIEDEVDKWDMELSQIGTITSIGGMVHYVGPFNAEQLKEYYEDTEKRDIDEETENGQTYYLDKKSNGGFAYMLVAGGFLRGSKEDIENTINAMTKGKDKLADDKGFQQARQLTDFNATSFSLQWDELKGMREGLKRQFEQIEKDKDFLDAFDDIDGVGQAQYWRGDFEQVLKILFSKDKSAEEVEKVLKDNKKKILETIPDMVMPSFFFHAKDRSEIKDLEDQVTIGRSGAILEIRTKFNWDQVEKIFKGK